MSDVIVQVSPKELEVSVVQFKDTTVQVSAGLPGPGVASGGTTGQILAKLSDESFSTQWVPAGQPLDAALTALAAGSDFVQFTGPLTTTKVFTLPDVSSTLLFSGGALGTPTSGILTNATGLPTTGLVDLAVTTAKVANLAVTSAKLSSPLVPYIGVYGYCSYGYSAYNF